MARKKVPIQPTLSTWQDVDDAMKEILNCVAASMKSR